MNKISFSLFNVISVILIIIFLIFAVSPFNLIDMKQAQRIAKWKADYEQINYAFSLLNMYEGTMVPINMYLQLDNFDENISNKIMVSKIKDYLELENDNLISYKKYKYKRKNGRKMPKHSQFYFNRFLKSKDGSLISFRKNVYYSGLENQPLFYMFVDINGEEKPNEIGEDIFFIDIFKHKIEALGYDKAYSRLKQNCSPIGSGVYCSEFYLLGGQF